MLQIEQVKISQKILESYFTCDLRKCQGACCTQGQIGAELEYDEIIILEKYKKNMQKYLPIHSQEIIENRDFSVKNESSYHTQSIQNQCIFAVSQQDGIALCGIELAYQNEEIPLKKPISCELYPIKIKKYHIDEKNIEVLFFYELQMCKPACELGKKLSMPMFRFMKEGLIKKYGLDWYNQLEEYYQNQLK